MWELGANLRRMLLLSDEVHLISRSDIVVVAMIQNTEEMDAMTETIEKSEAEVRTISKSVKMSEIAAEKKIELCLVQEVRRRLAKETDLQAIEDAHLKTTRPK